MTGSNELNLKILQGFRGPTEDALKAMILSAPQPMTKEGVLRLGIGQ